MNKRKNHLLECRYGWQGEHLARYIISKFAFIAEPSTVSDDIGSDFICTTFEIYEESPHKYLLPKSSFALQIKSSKQKIKKIKVTNKLKYLNGLEIPYFVGIVNQKDNVNSICIYSGEYLPHFFSLRGYDIKQEVYLRPCNDGKKIDLSWDDPQKIMIDIPKVLELSFDFDIEKDGIILKDFYTKILNIQKKISSRISGEFLFWDEQRNSASLFAGPGSIQTYQKNFIDRLTEAFYNMYWKRTRNIFDQKEFDMYEKIYLLLNEKYGNILPNILNDVYMFCKVP